MDTSVFLIKRQDLLERMENRRRAVEAELEARRKGPFGWLMKSAGWVTGLGTNGSSGRWLGSLLWMVLIPAFVAMLRRGGDTLAQKLIQEILPGRHGKEPSKR